MAQMVTHRSANQAQSCLTSVIEPWMVTPCQRAHNMTTKQGILEEIIDVKEQIWITNVKFEAVK